MHTLWRSLDELGGAGEFAEHLEREFPASAVPSPDEAHDGRRNFLKLMGASLALAGLASCSPPKQGRLLPYVEEQERITPGKALFYATTLRHNGYGRGVLVESRMGRPVKIEGNPDHPASLGATDILMQASLLTLYDPNRSKNLLYNGQVATWERFAGDVSSRLRRRGNGGGLRILVPMISSPTLNAQLATLLDEYPEAQLHLYDPARPGAESNATPVYNFDEAEIILSLDTNFLTDLPGSVRYARDFADRRRVREGASEMNRLYALESSPTLTGAAADHALSLPPEELASVARAIASRVGRDVPSIQLKNELRNWAFVTARDLRARGSRAVVVAGPGAPPALQALARSMNESLGSVGTAVEYRRPPLAAAGLPHADLRSLCGDIAEGEVDTLLMIGGNPAYNAPADIPFEEALREVPASIHLSLFHNETSNISRWHIPRTHELESWSDARAYDGTPSLIQPLIAPLYNGRSMHEVLSVFSGAPRTGYDTVREYWRGRVGDGDFRSFWRAALHAGVITGEGSGVEGGRVGGLEGGRVGGVEGSLASASSLSSETSTAPPVRAPAPESLTLLLRPDPSINYGEYANNGWLQELPRPLTKLVWGNAAIISVSTADEYDLENEDVVELTYRGRALEAPVWVMPGHPDRCVTLHLGHGRPRAGEPGETVGVNAYRLRFSDAPWGGGGLEIRKTGESFPLATTQHHHSMEGRDLVYESPIERFRENPDFIHEGKPIELPSLLPEYEYPDYKWGMVIDLNTCIGCNACVVACQAENNIPVVGKEQVRMGREMHWIRIDRYYKGPADAPQTFFQPVPCMQCEKAPCELVCPVAATVHDSEGLNVMVYNRCIGTRYCSNNCPYKVRRFNFLQYADWYTESTRAMRNPDVTPRSRGVMEKCTYCVQRISTGRIRAKREDRRIRDGEVMTACQQACPTRAITFGDLNDEAAGVHHLSEEPHNYELLGELGTRPRTTYLANFQNPNEVGGQ